VVRLRPQLACLRGSLEVLQLQTSTKGLVRFRKLVRRWCDGESCRRYHASAPSRVDSSSGGRRLRPGCAYTLVSVGLATSLFASGIARGDDLQSLNAVERGRYLATAADCAACHTKPGGEPFAGGVALQTPFGTLVGPNITPDPTAGIGSWTDDEFVSALAAATGAFAFIRRCPIPPIQK
jgi:hypothetical protein